VAGKSDFTDEEWEQLRRGVTGAGLWVATSDRSFFDSFNEAASMAKYLADSQLVRELASERGTGFHFGESPKEVESGAMEALQAATMTLRAKAPDEFEPYPRDQAPPRPSHRRGVGYTSSQSPRVCARARERKR
jgi:hypothetical protein